MNIYVYIYIYTHVDTLSESVLSEGEDHNILLWLFCDSDNIVDTV